jgi:hypothetical protein
MLGIGRAFAHLIADLIRNEVEGLIDKRRWRAAIAYEERGRRLLAGAAENWAVYGKRRKRITVGAYGNAACCGCVVHQ